MLNNTLPKLNLKLLITNTTVATYIDDECSKYVQTFRNRFLIYFNDLHVTGIYMVRGNFSKQAIKSEINNELFRMGKLIILFN